MLGHYFRHGAKSEPANSHDLKQAASAGAQAWIAKESSGSESTHRGELPVAARREDHQLALLGSLAGGVLNGDEVGDEDHITPDRRRPEDLTDLADNA